MPLPRPQRYIFLCLSLPCIIAGASCDRREPVDSTKSAKSEKPSTEWIDPNKIQSGPTVHDSLSNDLVTRIKCVHRTFADVDGTPLDKWIAGFKRDLDPEGNVRIWEDMQTAYTTYCDGRDLPVKARKEVYKIVLLRSMASAADVLDRIELSILTEDDATEIMNGYPSPPKPIEVIEPEQ